MTKILDGKLFCQLFISGANNIINSKNKIDALNVFPVPDGDTGTNMSSTAQAAADALALNNSNHLGEVTNTISRNMLLGARGNSGVILSQIFKGFAIAFKEVESVDIKGLLEGFKQATKKAYSSVLKPVEGTILTVIRETTEALEKEVNNKTSLEEFFKLAKNAARKACDNTPNKLKILREVGVTDSGGEGLYTIISGMEAALNAEAIKISESEENIDTFISSKEVYDGEFGYCTEFIIELNDEKDFDKANFEKSLLKKANSLVVVQDEKIVKVHGHTLKPGDMLNFGQKYGEFIKIKSENMTRQASESRNKNVIINQNDEQSNKKCAIISCNLGSGIIARMKEFGVDAIIESGQTQNPSAQDIIDAINSVNSKNVFILPNNSNIFLAAEQAAQAITNKKVFIIQTRSQIQGLTALMNFNSESSPKENRETMSESIKLVTTAEVTQAIRSTKIDNVKIKEGQFIGITDGKILVSENNYIDAAKKLIKKSINSDHELVTVYYGNDASEVDANEIKNFLESHYDVEVEVVNGAQPNYHFIIGFE
ncbi:DAK2 domain-containing protein [Mycoplasmopsis fermentans]|uniref:DhaL domain-containing protein n=2 Tax=Mycoplasmopsis fermentans TaxID=2115 RepID=C4XDU6_MYCFP|nr:DAK2 domain-containing protein [Mycoplasmopsis fermentans]VEU67108.1 kinase [Mesomycoplasma conjunctivae]ADN69105.1 predicted kinase [Mycoplasmopsis fermentans JER]ADV34626.1 Glycerone kinase [Mycoplasmopsis fermentans M64]RMX35312.1 DAK2 domain fusion YloV family protein [Mycoplasmopsis fermentans MF-I2]RMX35452.1 DAK2 domain fusion YloV family protein [Mycoplasmopsis fermentans MF-I1]